MNLALVKELQAQRLSLSVCLCESTNRAGAFPRCCTSITTCKTFSAPGWCPVKAGRSSEQRSESGQMGHESSAVPGAALRATPSDPQRAGRGCVLPETSQGFSDIHHPLGSGISGCYSQDFHAGWSRVPAAKSGSITEMNLSLR